MIDVEQASPLVKALRDAMSALSEQLFSASWHQGCEHPIWEALAVPASSWRRRSEPHLLRVLASTWIVVQGWVVWDEHFDRLVWLTTEEWLRMRREHAEVV